MTLTVPRAGVTAGRAPGIQVEPDETGAVVAQFGQRIAQAGDAILNDALDRQATRLQIDMTKALGEARLEFEQMNDPDAIDAGWTQRAAELRQRFVTGDERNPINPRLRERVGLAFDELANRHALALGARAVEARQNQRAAQLVEYTQAVTTQAASADPETRQVLLRQFRDDLDRRVAANELTPLEATQLYITESERVYNAAAIEMIDSNPQGYLDADAAGAFSELSPETAAANRVRAQGKLEAMDEANRREAERVARERTAEIGGELDAILTLAKGGEARPGAAQFLADPEVQAHPRYREVQAQVLLLEAKPDIMRMTPAEIDAIIADEDQRPKIEGWELDIGNALEAAREQITQGWQQDGIAFARQQGFRVPELDLTDVGSDVFADGLRARVEFANRAVAEGYTDLPPIFSDAELEQLKTAAGVGADPAARAALAASIQKATQGNADDVLAAIEADTVFQFATGLIGSTGSKSLAASMFRGQQKIDGKTVNMPSPRDQVLLFDDVTGGLFDDQPRIKAEIMAAAAALYADTAAGIAPEDVETGYFRDGEGREAYSRAVQRALGAVQLSGGEYVGGVQDVPGNGRMILPHGIRASEVADARDRIANGFMMQPVDVNGVPLPPEPGTSGPQVDPDILFGALRRSSVSPDPARRGQTRQVNPDFLVPADRPLGPREREALYQLWQQTRFVRVGEDEYALIYTDQNGVEVELPAADGGPFRVSLRRLVREVKR
jgi:hypothetical protein